MRVDLLRSCYRTKARFFSDSDELRTIRWFFAPPGAKWFTFPVAINSRNWDSDKVTLRSVGEDPDSPRSYDKGAVPPNVTGQHFCGTEEQFTQGALAAEPPLPRDANDVPTCCSGLVPVVRGQFNLIGQIRQVVVSPTIPCLCCGARSIGLPITFDIRLIVNFGPLLPWNLLITEVTYGPALVGTGNAWSGTFGSIKSGPRPILFQISCQYPYWSTFFDIDGGGGYSWSALGQGQESGSCDALNLFIPQITGGIGGFSAIFLQFLPPGFKYHAQGFF